MVAGAADDLGKDEEGFAPSTAKSALHPPRQNRKREMFQQKERTGHVRSSTKWTEHSSFPRLFHRSPHCCITACRDFFFFDDSHSISFARRQVVVFFFLLPASLNLSFPRPAGRYCTLPARQNHLCQRALVGVFLSSGRPLWPRGRLRC